MRRIEPSPEVRRQMVADLRAWLDAREAVLRADLKALAGVDDPLDHPVLSAVTEAVMGRLDEIADMRTQLDALQIDTPKGTEE